MTQDTITERIRERAHRIWIEAGQPYGDQHAHWEKARQEIEAEGEKKMIENQRPPD